MTYALLHGTALFCIFLFASQAYALEDCPSNCLDSECSSLGCVMCKQGYYLIADEGQGKSICVDSCPKGYYTNPVDWCEKCETTNCAVCSDEYTCTTCEPNYETTAEGDCIFSPYQLE